jgi:hypothetical protein
MRAHGAFTFQSRSRHTLCILMLFLIAFLIASSRSLGDTLVNPNHEMSRSAKTSGLDSGDSLEVARADLGAVPQRIPHAILGVVRWSTSRIIEEVGKQAIDQPGHFLIGAAPIWASRCLVGVPWFCWVGAPILAYREWLQWPSRRWWDPPLDWAFLTLGAVAATWGRRRRPGFAAGFAAVGRRMVSGLAFHGRLPQRA